VALTLVPPQIIPLTEAPAQVVHVTLNGQDARINVYTKSINVPIALPGMTLSDPNPVYENANPVFMDLYVNDNTTGALRLVIGGVILLNECLTVINPYLGFVGDLVIIDTQGNEDPAGASLRLPPLDLRNRAQRDIPLSRGGERLVNGPNTIPGLGTRWLLTYWPNLK
jgi:hypothetical protein